MDWVDRIFFFIYKFHSEILASLNFKKTNFVPSNLIIYVKIVGKIPYLHLSVWLFSNQGDKVQIRVESTGLICPAVLHLFWTLSPGFENNNTFSCWYGIFPTIFTYNIMLKNCQNSISVYACSPIQGTKCYSCWKGNRTIADLRYGGKDIISPSTLIFAPIKS